MPWLKRMTQVHRVAILIPMPVGAGAVLCTIFIHALALGATVNFVRHERRLGRTVECPANSVPAGVRQTGMEGAKNGARKEAYS